MRRSELAPQPSWLPPGLGRGAAEGDPETSNQAAETWKQGQALVGAVATTRARRRSAARKTIDDARTQESHRSPRSGNAGSLDAAATIAASLPRGNGTSSAATDDTHFAGRQNVGADGVPKPRAGDSDVEPRRAAWVTIAPRGAATSRGPVGHDRTAGWVTLRVPLKLALRTHMGDQLGACVGALLSACVGTQVGTTGNHPVSWGAASWRRLGSHASRARGGRASGEAWRSRGSRCRVGRVATASGRIGGGSTGRPEGLPLASPLAPATPLRSPGVRCGRPSRAASAQQGRGVDRASRSAPRVAR